MKISNRTIGSGAPCYIIAEMSANHNNDIVRAREIVHAAAEAGANALKLQTYTADSLTIDCDQDCFQIGTGTIWEGRTLHDLYCEASMPWEWTAELMALSTNLGMTSFSTPFDKKAVDFLEAQHAPAYKVASFELVDHMLLRHIAETGKPVIMSTGMASLSEIDEAVHVLKKFGATEIALLKCTSAYPALPSEMNLHTIPHLADAFGLPSGLSDHTHGIAVPVAAVALGACIVEKHLTMSRSDEGPDSSFSLNPQEFSDMVQAIRVTEKSLGAVSYTLSEGEASSRIFRRSLFVVKDIARGESFTIENVRSIRPGYGLVPKYLPSVVGRSASRDIKRGTPMQWDLIL